MSKQRNIAVIGAGMAGLAAARSLVSAGQTVKLFDKARGVGGRLSVRREGAWSFDHGAQYFTARDERFARQVEAWVQAGVATRWPAELVELHHGSTSKRDDATERFVGTPGMNAVGKHLANGLAVETQSRITRIERSAAGWTLWREDGTEAGVFTDVLLSVPAPQAVPLLTAAPALQERAAAVVMEPCWAVMCAFDDAWNPPLAAGFSLESPLSWVACNSTKPGRTGRACWVLHATPAWSNEHLESTPETVAELLLAAFFEAVGGAPRSPHFVRAHRWRYARATQPLQAEHLWDSQQRIGACGDWCADGRVEGAYLSGLTLADRILREG